MTDDLEAVLGVAPGQLLRLQRLDEVRVSTAYVSGSLLDGFGNRGSDVDVFVITDEKPRSPTVYADEFSITVDFAASRRIDYEYWSPRRVEALAEKQRSIDLSGDFSPVLQFAERSFIHRIKIGAPILNPPVFERLRGGFDFARFQQYLVRDSIKQLDNALDDLCGLLEDEEWDVALFRARDVLGFAVDVWTAHRGITNPSPKWRLKKLRALPPEEASQRVLDHYLQLQLRDASILVENGGACRRYLEECIGFADRITDEVLG
jgi:hypothetical protein